MVDIADLATTTTLDDAAVVVLQPAGDVPPETMTGAAMRTEFAGCGWQPTGMTVPTEATALMGTDGSTGATGPAGPAGADSTVPRANGSRRHRRR